MWLSVITAQLRLGWGEEKKKCKFPKILFAFFFPASSSSKCLFVLAPARKRVNSGITARDVGIKAC